MGNDNLKSLKVSVEKMKFLDDQLNGNVRIYTQTNKTNREFTNKGFGLNCGSKNRPESSLVRIYNQVAFRLERDL